MTMTELTNAQLRQIREALKTGIRLSIYHSDNKAHDELQAAFQLVDAVLYPPAAKVETAPVAAKALTPAQMKLARRMDCEATVYVPAGSALYRTAKPMWTKGLIEIVEKGALGDYYGLTEKGYEALRETAIANRS